MSYIADDRVQQCDHKLTNHNVNQFQPITAVHSQITTCEVKGYVNYHCG